MAGERDGEAGGIGIGRRPGLALAPGRFAMLLEVGRPDDRARRPHPPDMARDRLAVARCGDLQLVEPRALALGAADDRAVDLPSGQRAERAAQRAADQRADGAEDQGCHRDLLQCAQDRRAGAGFGEKGLQDDPAQRGMGMDDRVGSGRDREVMLGGAGPQKKDVTPLGLALARHQSGLRREGKEGGDVGIAQGISCRCRNDCAAAGERRRHQTHAVEPVSAIATEEAEGHSDKGFRRLGKAFSPVHRGIG